ncbi:hypothetical protein DL771_009807 [Monosporascus sp. 5C6A]|nr:hypothetical protein DL771_009807 [Monosporascus sp. 5C6A]
MTSSASNKRPASSQECPCPKRVRLEQRQSREPSILLDLIIPLDGDPYRVIRTCLMQYFDAGDVLHLCATSRLLRDTVKKAAFDINARLRRFFDNPTEFRTELGRCDALITGPFALQFFERATWPDSNLQILVEDGRNFERLKAYFLKIGHHIAREVIYEGSNVQSAKIELKAMRWPPVKAILRRTPTSCLINFISWNKAFSIFPRLTFMEHETLPLRTIPSPMPQMMKYWNVSLNRCSRLGWRVRSLPPNKQVDRKLLGDIWHDHFGDSACSLGRRVGDYNTWMVPLDTTSVATPATPDFVLEYASFSMRPQSSQPMHTPVQFYEQMAYSIDVQEFCSPVLRYRYVYGPVLVKESMSGGGTQYRYLLEPVWGSLNPMFKRATLIQLCKLDEPERQRVLRGIGWPPDLVPEPVFEKPETWDYMDDEVPKWFARLIDNPRLLDSFDFSNMQ